MLLFSPAAGPATLNSLRVHVFPSRPSLPHGLQFVEMRVASFVFSLAAVVASVKGAVVPAKRCVISFRYLRVVLLNKCLRARATVCNGHAELCNRSYGNTTFLGGANHSQAAYCV